MSREDWTDTCVESLKTLWSEGLSCSQIARALGPGFTRNSVIGKATRMGLPARSPTRKRREYVPSTRSRAPSLPAPVLVAEDPLLLPDGSFVTMLTVSDKTCRWPLGEPTSSDFHFCGRAPKTGSPYCEAHARQAYQAPQERGERDQEARAADASQQRMMWKVGLG